jgi:hypothetical protein
VRMLDRVHTEGARRTKDESAGVSARRSGRSVLWPAGAAVPRTVAPPRDEGRDSVKGKLPGVKQTMPHRGNVETHS